MRTTKWHPYRENELQKPRRAGVLTRGGERHRLKQCRRRCPGNREREAALRYTKGVHALAFDGRPWYYGEVQGGGGKVRPALVVRAHLIIMDLRGCVRFPTSCPMSERRNSSTEFRGSASRELLFGSVPHVAGRSRGDADLPGSSASTVTTPRFSFPTLAPPHAPQRCRRRDSPGSLPSSKELSRMEWVQVLTIFR